METPKDRFPKLIAAYAVLDEQRALHATLYLTISDAAGGQIYAADLFMQAALKRSLDLLDAIVCLIDRWNFVAAGPLLRLQIDTLLRLVYLATLTNADEMAIAMLQGKRLKEKGASGKPLTDARMRELARPMYPWIDRVYSETSKLIHFSDKHFFSPVTSVADRTVETYFGVGMPHWNERDVAELLCAFGVSTDAILKNVLGWIIHKDKAHGCTIADRLSEIRIPIPLMTTGA